MEIAIPWKTCSQVQSPQPTEIGYTRKVSGFSYNSYQRHSCSRSTGPTGAKQIAVSDCINPSSLLVVSFGLRMGGNTTSKPNQRKPNLGCGSRLGMSSWGHGIEYFWGICGNKLYFGLLVLSTWGIFSAYAHYLEDRQQAFPGCPLKSSPSFSSLGQ